MLTLHRKRRIGGTVTRDTNPHAMHYRACNSDRFDGDDDALGAAKGILLALALCALSWIALAAVGVWALEILVGAQ